MICAAFAGHNPGSLTVCILSRGNHDIDVVALAQYASGLAQSTLSLKGICADIEFRWQTTLPRKKRRR